MSAYRIARRAFLRSCGGSIALLAPLLRGIEARAQGMPAPLRSASWSSSAPVAATSICGAPRRR
jgi:hypothetical protein